LHLLAGVDEGVAYLIARRSRPRGVLQLRDSRALQLEKPRALRGVRRLPRAGRRREQADGKRRDDCGAGTAAPPNRPIDVGIHAAFILAHNLASR
jgi:hypothetical protein